MAGGVVGSIGFHLHDMSAVQGSLLKPPAEEGPKKITGHIECGSAVEALAVTFEHVLHKTKFNTGHGSIALSAPMLDNGHASLSANNHVVSVFVRNCRISKP